MHDKDSNRMNRRRFLQTSGLVAAGVAAVQAGAVLIEPNRAWAVTATALNEHQARTLLAMARQLFPHDELGDPYYVAAVAALDRQVAENPAFATQLADGIAALDEAMGVPFADLSAGNQVRALQAIEGTEFFNTVRGTMLAALYTHPTVERHFGFEGSSVEFGGYIDRGFNDLGWLPELPDNA